MLLNFGDVYDWGFAHARAFKGAVQDFEAWLAAAIARDGVTDLLLYGESSPYCIRAGAVAAKIGLRIHTFEQGYFRPFWITLKRHGADGSSSLPVDPAFYLAAAASAPEPKEDWLPPLTPSAVRHVFIYHALQILGSAAFPRYRPHYQHGILRQGLGHVRRYLRQRLCAARERRDLRAFMAREGSLFVVILQRPGDSQLRRHSAFDSTVAFIDHVIANFAHCAPIGANLVFKAHPLDHGLAPHGKIVARAALAAGVGGRVFFVDRGELTSILDRAQGAVTVNSTAGVAAIEAGVPTIALGSAIYDMPGLTHQGGLDVFWTSPEPPDGTLYRAFRRVVMARTQINGAYATARGVDMAAPEATRRLLAD